jgi:hypothetical protein
MEGFVLSFLKAEWKVSDTGSAHWASSFFQGGHFFFAEGVHRCFLSNFGSFGYSVSEEKII